MAPHDPFDDMEEDEKTYHESSDEDFNPTAAPADESSASSNENEDEDKDNAEQATSKKNKGKSRGKPGNGKLNNKRKRKAPATDELDSGDEATIEAANQRKAKKQQKANQLGGDSEDDDDSGDNGLLWSDDEGGEGGLIRTRAQRRVEPKEKRPLARTDGATVDVEALWAAMSAAPLHPVVVDPKNVETGHDASLANDSNTIGGGARASAQEEEAAHNETDTVLVRKTYTFAGQRTTEEKHVPRSILKGQLAEGWKQVAATAAGPSPSMQEKGSAGDNEGDSQSRKQTQDGQEVSQSKVQRSIRRPPRRPSRFDPNPTGFVRGLLPEHQLTWPRKVTASTNGQQNVPAPEAHKIARPDKAQKLNVVDKSRLDWTGFVDKEGIAEELQVHGKTKEAYLGRMDFLAGVEARQEEERRRAKPTTTVS